MHAEGVDDLANPASFDYVYDENEDGSGDFQFAIDADFEDSATTAHEQALIRSRWLPTGAGRGDAMVSGGDLADVEVSATECWDTQFRRVFYTDSAELAADRGRRRRVRLQRHRDARPLDPARPSNSPRRVVSESSPPALGFRALTVLDAACYQAALKGGNKMPPMPKDAQELFDNLVPEALEKYPDKANELNAIYCFKITGDGGGEWTVDLTVGSADLHPGRHRQGAVHGRSRARRLQDACSPTRTSACSSTSRASSASRAIRCSR